MIEGYQTIQDCRLRTISDAKHRIVMSALNAASIHAAFYYTRPRQYVLKKEKVDQMIKTGVVNLATIEWESPVVFLLCK